MPSTFSFDNQASAPAAADAAEMAHATAQLRATHRQETGLLQQTHDRFTAVIGWPGFVVILMAAVLTWVLGNLAAQWFGLVCPDPPPFVWLQTATSTGALVLAALILTTQRREDKLADYRAQLILELTISNDQKNAKIVALLEEGRRDNPAIVDRIDDQADAMSVPCDTDAVLEAIKELRADIT